MRIVGLDLSLTATGLDNDGDPCVYEPDTKGPQRLLDILGYVNIRVFNPKADLVIVEGYSYASANQAHQIGELGGVIRLNLHCTGVPYIEIPPGTLKKFATGKGNAGKDQMVACAARLGCPAHNNNAVDAWHLRNMGLYAYNLDCATPQTSYRDEVIAKIEWPKL